MSVSEIDFNFLAYLLYMGVLAWLILRWVMTDADLARTIIAANVTFCVILAVW